MSIEWIQWGDAPAWFGGGVAVIAALYAARQAREARRSRESSEAAANRSNEIAARQLELAEAAAKAAEPPKVKWRIEHVANLQFRLRNIGADTATGVTAEDRRPDGLARDLPQGVEIRSYESHAFLLLEVAEYPTPSEVWVRWDGEAEPVAVPVATS